MHTADLDGTSECVNGSCKWKARVTVLVVDAHDDPVAGAAVTLGWDNGRSMGTKACTTGGNGTCTVSKTNGSRRSSITFTVNGVTHPALMYDPAGNCDPDGDSDGTTITISRP